MSYVSLTVNGTATATIREQLVFFCARATYGYYSRATTIQCAATIQVNTVYNYYISIYSTYYNTLLYFVHVHILL